MPRTPRGEETGTIRVRAAFRAGRFASKGPGSRLPAGYREETHEPTPSPPAAASAEAAGRAISGARPSSELQAPRPGRWATSLVTTHHEVTRESRGNEGASIHASQHPYCASSKPSLAARPGRGLGDRRTFLAGWSPWMLLMPGGPAGCMWAPTGRCCGC